MISDRTEFGSTQESGKSGSRTGYADQPPHQLGGRAVWLSPSLWEGREASLGELTRGGLIRKMRIDRRAAPPRRLVPRLRPSRREGEISKRMCFRYLKPARPPGKRRQKTILKAYGVLTDCHQIDGSRGHVDYMTASVSRHKSG